MKKTLKYFLPILCMIAALAALTLAAAAATETGSCGTDLTYTLDTETGVLTVSGTGTHIQKPTLSDSSLVRSIVIPEGVRSMMYNAFSDCGNLESITIPTTLTTVLAQTFGSCEKLNAVHISDLAAWAKHSFIDAASSPLYYAHHLYLNGELVTEVALPEGTEYLNSYSFAGCTDLVSVTIPARVSSIGLGVFYGCTNLQTITVSDDNTMYVCENNVLMDAERTNVISAAPAAFSGRFTAPENTVSICEGAFYGCRGLTDVVLGDKVRYIGEGAFADTAWYDAQPDGAVYLGKVLLTYKGTMPENTDFTVREGTTAIADRAFYGHWNLKTLRLPVSLTNIGCSAFEAAAPERVYLMDLDAWCSVRLGSVFGRYRRTSEASSPFLGGDYDTPCDLYVDGTLVTDLVIPDGVETIHEYAFAGCTVKSISIPDSVTAIEPNAFYMTAPASVYTDGIAYIDNWAVAREDDWESDRFTDADLTFPEGTVGIAESLFASSEIKSVTLPASVKYVGEMAFDFCDNLTDATVLNPACKIAGYAFSDNATIHGYKNSTAKDYAIDYGNRFVALDETVSYEGTCGNGVRYVFGKDAGVLTISGTGAMTDFYAATPAPWSSYAASVRAVKLEEGVTTLGNLALEGCVKLESLSLPTTLTEIGTGNLPTESPMWQSAAAGEICVDGWLVSYKGTTPQDLRLSDGIRGMANGVFAWDSVKTAVLPGSLLYVGKDTFLSCDALTDVTILNPDCIISHTYLPFPQSTTLHGYRGSTAEAYASMYGNPFVALDPTVGDADGDGKCTIRDALLTVQTLLDGKFAAAADMNGDGKLTLADVILLLRAIR